MPNFRADMSPPEIASMIESFYRIRAGVDRVQDDRASAAHLPRPSRLPVRLRAISTATRSSASGRAVGAIIDDRFYLALFDAARMHYFPAALPEFERIVESARLKR